MSTQGIANALDVEDVGPIPALSQALVLPEAFYVKSNAELDVPQAQHDIEVSRQNTFEFIELGRAALNSALIQVQESENPRSIEVFATLLKNVSEVNKQLIDTHTAKKGMTTVKSDNVTNVTNNALFVGSTNELAKMLQGMRNG